MRREIRELDLYDLSRPRAGEVAPWVRAVIGGAAVSAIGVAAASAHGLWDAEGSVAGVPGFWFRNGLALAMLAAVAAAFAPPSRGSRFVRLAALLPLILLGGMGAAWVLWEVFAPAMPSLRRAAPLLRDVPIGAALGGTAAAVAAAAILVGHRRFEAWVRAAVVIALVYLLVLGLWLPLVSSWWGARPDVQWVWSSAPELGFASAQELAFGAHVLSIPAAPELVGLALVPPLGAATAFAVFAQRWPALVRRGRAVWAVALWVLFSAAMVHRLDTSAEGYFVYLNLVHFVAAAACVAAAALVGLVATLWLRGRLARRRLAREEGVVSGVIPDDDAEERRRVVACLELEGWLGGPRALVDSFEVVTPVGRVPVPLGADLAATHPPVTTVLHPGEAVAVIRRGDRVLVGGLVAPPSDHPFRSAGALVPGPGGIVVRKADDRGGDFADIALVAWRPCVALLVILTAVAVPALAAVLVLE